MREKIDQAANGIGGRPLALATCSTGTMMATEWPRQAFSILINTLGGIGCSGISVATSWLYRSSNSS